jgi:hypothetical protein
MVCTDCGFNLFLSYKGNRFDCFAFRMQVETHTVFAAGSGSFHLISTYAWFIFRAEANALGSRCLRASTCSFKPLQIS